MTKPSILSAVRAEGYRDGVGQMSMLCYDEAFEKGRREGEASGYRPSRWVRAIYWFIGLTMGGFSGWWLS